MKCGHAPAGNEVAATLQDAKIDNVMALIRAELVRATSKHPTGFHNAHEGYAVLKEEVDELWDEVKRDNLTRAKEEAVQVGAMAARFLFEL